jgi:hypothetical protein
VTAFTPAAWMMLTVLFLRSPTNLRAYGADDDKAHPAISILYSVRLTLTNHYWVTSDERRRGDDANEAPLPFDATDGDWKMSLPCPTDDLTWVQNSLKGKTARISARDMATVLEDEDDSGERQSSGDTVDLEAFFKS